MTVKSAALMTTLCNAALISLTYNEDGTVDNAGTWGDTDISGEDASVQVVCNAVWTASIKLLMRHLGQPDDIGAPMEMSSMMFWNV